MVNEQMKRVRDLFERALDVEPSQLTAWLSQAADDPDVRAEVASLLQHHSRAESFLSNPVLSRLTDLFADDSALEPGTQLGTYRIVREIGRGGMGRVYLAEDIRLGRTVAVKALPPQLTRDEGQRERLRREARAAAVLGHPGICTVHALEEFNGELFIITEYVDGHTLREEIAGGARPSAAEVRATARELASALASAHAKGITHRDLKPENVMRSSDGRLKILDFGLARFEHRSEETAAHITVPGSVIGTPAYMAPEQLNGQPATPRSDIFSLGVLLYEYAAGVHPFAASSPLAIAARVLESSAPNLAGRSPDLSPALVAVIERCLQKSPALRFSSAGELLAALDASGDAPAGAPQRGAAGWWRTHQVVVIGLYFAASVLAWQIKEWQSGMAMIAFLTISVAATVAGVFRGHLLFTERVNNAVLQSEQRRAGPVTLSVDLIIAVALLVDGLNLFAARPVPAVLTLALAVSIGLVRLIIEPATAAAAFKKSEV